MSSAFYTGRKHLWIVFSFNKELDISYMLVVCFFYSQLWKDFEEVTKTEEIVEDNTERNVSYKSIVVTEVGEDLKFFGQLVDNGPELEKLMEQLRQDMAANPPLPGAYTPKRNDLCVNFFCVRLLL